MPGLVCAFGLEFLRMWLHHAITATDRVNKFPQMHALEDMQ